MTLKKCVICCTAAFLLGLLTGVFAVWKLSNRYTLHEGTKGVYRINGLTGETWQYTSSAGGTEGTRFWKAVSEP